MCHARVVAIIALMFQAPTRTANTALTLLNICAWAYALLATAHAIA